jgi:hypothetical protein
MHQAGQPRSVIAAASPLAPPADSPRLRIATIDPVASVSAKHEAEIVLGPAGTFGESYSEEREVGRGDERCRQLAIAIRQRIETRLAGRVRDLAVRIKGDTILLEGRCATYYTKQLAQHAALGVIEDEHLENAIVVSVS